MIFEYSQSVPIWFGAGAVRVLGEEVAKLGCRKALCLYDKGGEISGAADKAVNSLEAAGISCVRYNKVVADPPIEMIDEAGELGLLEKVDCIVGIGGGSAIDTAKAVSILMTNPGPIKQYVLAKPITVNTVVPIVCVPTTAGTGAEATRVAIVNRTDVNGKWSVFVRPTLAVVDPELTVTLPKTETANTGLDALAHAAECMTCTVANPHSQLFAFEAIRRINDWLYTAWSEPDNMQARTEMALAADWAGIAFGETMCHVGHALADGLSCEFHTPHGYNCALALPVALEYAAPAVPEAIRKVAEALRLPLNGDEDAKTLGALVGDAVRALMRKVGVKPLRDMGFTRERVLVIAKEGSESHLSSYCPVPVSYEAALKMAGDMYDKY